MVLDDLSPTQRRVARMVAECATNKQICAALNLHSRTVEKHLSAIADRWQLDRSKNLRAQIVCAYIADTRLAA